MGDQRPQLIERIFAWVCPDGEGGEGVAGASIGMTMMPLVGADQERMESLRPIAQDICNGSAGRSCWSSSRSAATSRPLSLP